MRGGANSADTAFFATHPTRILQQQQLSEANQARGRRWRGDTYSHRGYRGGQSSYRGGQFSYRGGQHSHLGGQPSDRGRQRGRGGRGCWNCGMTNHKSYNCWNKKDEERKDARSDQFDRNRNYESADNSNNSFAALSSLCFVARKSFDWYADSGATHHMTDQRSFFSSFKEIAPDTWKVNGIGSSQLNALGIGNIPVHSYVQGVRRNGELQDVLFVPGLGTNLFSIGIATDSGIDVHFIKDTVAFMKNGQEIMSGQRVGKSLYHLKVIAKNSYSDNSYAAAANSTTQCLSLWHQRLAHLNCKTILKMVRTNAVDGLELNNDQLKNQLCEGCIFGKMSRSPFPTSNTKAEDIGHIIHSDIGIVPMMTPGGECYYAIFKDDYSNWTSVVLMKKKSDVADYFIKFAAFVNTATGKTVKILRTDGGKEYDNTYLNNYLAKSGIIHQTSTAYTPQQNGVSERMNRTAIESTRSSLHMRNNRYTDVFKKTNNHILELWGEFLKSAIYVLNRTLSTSVTSNSSLKTPFELFFKKKPNIKNLRVIGCRAYVHIPDCKRKKLDPKAIPCWLVGYGEETKGWRLWDPSSRKVILSRDVTFDEHLLINDFKDEQIQNSTKQSDCTLVHPFLLATEILNMDLGLFPDEEIAESFAGDPNDEQPDISLETVDEQPAIIIEDGVRPHETIVLENPLSPDNVFPDHEEEVLPPPEAMEPVAHQEIQQAETDVPRRSSRTPKYSARYKELRKSIGLTGLIGNFGSLTNFSKCVKFS